jgi:hypothetical protein
VANHVAPVCPQSSTYHAAPARERTDTWPEHGTSRPVARLPWPCFHGTCLDSRTSWSRFPWPPVPPEHICHTLGDSNSLHAVRDRQLLLNRRSIEVRGMSSSHPPSRASLTNFTLESLFGISANRCGAKSFRRPSVASCPTKRKLWLHRPLPRRLRLRRSPLPLGKLGYQTLSMTEKPSLDSTRVTAPEAQGSSSEGSEYRHHQAPSAYILYPTPQDNEYHAHPYSFSIKSHEESSRSRA